MLELSDKRRGWTFPFNEILSLVSFSDLTHLILRMVSQFELAFRTNAENAKTLCPEKLAPSFFQGKKKVLCGSESWRFTESLHLEISDIEIGYYIPAMSRYHAFCFHRGCFLKVYHSLTYNFVVYEGLSCMFIHLWDLYASDFPIFYSCVLFLGLTIFLLLIYLAALGLSCGTQDLHCVIWDFSLRHTGSKVAMHGLSCSMAWGILDPWSRIEPMSPALQDRFLTTGPPGKSLF